MGELRVSNTDDALGLLTNQGKCIRLEERIGIWRFSFDEHLRDGSKRLTSLEIYSKGERDHKVDSRDLSRDDGLSYIGVTNLVEEQHHHALVAILREDSRSPTPKTTMLTVSTSSRVQG